MKPAISIVGKVIDAGRFSTVIELPNGGQVELIRSGADLREGDKVALAIVKVP